MITHGPFPPGYLSYGALSLIPRTDKKCVDCPVTLVDVPKAQQRCPICAKQRKVLVNKRNNLAKQAALRRNRLAIEFSGAKR